ncbi:MAG TPA: hypothetical protein VGK23_06905 [Methanomassiliicoccales archaeon]
MGAERSPEQENQNMKLFESKKIGTERKRLGWIFALPLALAVAMHGLIHLMYVTWTGPGIELGFSGSSWIPDDAAAVLVPVLVAITIAGNCLGALGLLRIPLLKDSVVPLVIVGNVASLTGFAVMLPGLVPNADAHVYGMITSLVMILGAMHYVRISKAFGKVLPKMLAKRLGAQA